MLALLRGARRAPACAPSRSDRVSCATSASTSASASRCRSTSPSATSPGARVTLRDYFGDKPVMLVPAYYECPMLCTLVLNGLVERAARPALRRRQGVRRRHRELRPARDARARGREEGRLPRRVPPAGRRGAAGTSSPATRPSIAPLTRRDRLPLHVGRGAQAVRARERHRGARRRTGRISRYFYGVEFAPRDLRLGAGRGVRPSKIGSLVDQLLLFCFHYDPTTGPLQRASR